jgi:hypothetical protein
MAVPLAPVPLRHQFDSTTTIAVPVTTKQIQLWSPSAGAMATFGAAASSTYTFAANQTSSRTVFELLDLLDRALREGSATVA